MRISDWSSDVCSSDLALLLPFLLRAGRGCLATRHPVKHGIRAVAGAVAMVCSFYAVGRLHLADFTALSFTQPLFVTVLAVALLGDVVRWRRWRSEEHTSELQSLMRISYAVFCLNKKTITQNPKRHSNNVRI